MNKIRLQVEVGQEVFLVFASKKEKYQKNVVLLCKVSEARITEEDTTYTAIPLQCVNDSKVDVKNYANLWFRNANIDTGYRGHSFVYPVFTTKQKCISWLKEK